MPEKAVIDTCVFLEAVGEAALSSGYSEECGRIVNTAGHSFECILPIVVPGEYLERVKDESAGNKDRFDDLLSRFKRWLLNGNFRVVGMEYESFWKAYGRLDFLRGQHDRMIVACAIAEGCTVLYTTDDGIKEQEPRSAAVSWELAKYRLHISRPGESLPRKRKPK